MTDYDFMSKQELINELAKLIEKYIKPDNSDLKYKKRALNLAKSIYKIYNPEKKKENKK